MKLRDLVSQVIADGLLFLAERLDKRLDERLEKLAIPNFRDAWDRAAGYEPNDVVTADYSLWIATRKSNGVKPGTAAARDSWRLFVRVGPREATFSLDPKSCVLSVKMGDEPAAELGSIKPALIEALVKCGVLTAEQAKQLEA